MISVLPGAYSVYPFFDIACLIHFFLPLSVMKLIGYSFSYESVMFFAIYELANELLAFHDNFQTIKHIGMEVAHYYTAKRPNYEYLCCIFLFIKLLK